MNQQVFDMIILAVGFFTGYFLGSLNGNKKTIKEFTDETGQVIKIETKKLFNPKPHIPTGQIRHKTAQEIYKQQISPERREGLDEMKQTLDNIPDLVAAKELLQTMKKEEYGQV